jgi:hypothetical protein
VGKSLRMLLAGITDLLRTSIGLPPVYLPIAGACFLWAHAHAVARARLCTTVP